MTTMSFVPALLAVWVSSASVACKEKSPSFDAPLEAPEAVGLQGSVVLPDHALNRLLFLTAPSPQVLSTEVVASGQNIAEITASQDLSRLYVLSRGVVPRRSEDDERPRLSVYDGTATASDRFVDSFPLDDPMERLALDARGQWVAAFGGDAKLVNPNELVLFDLSSPDGDAHSRTIRSFGGAPIQLLFTDPLLVPGGVERRLLVVRTDRDVTLIDLFDLEQPETTIKLPEATPGSTPRPLEVVYDDGDPEDDSDARLAVRLENSPDVVIVELGPPSVEGRAFSPVLNIVDVGGVPSAIDFVRTDGGLRLAALVPTSRRATLVDPATTLTEVVSLPDAFSAMRRITSTLTEPPEGGDVALLWGTSKQIAFWSLGSTSETPYRSVDTAELSFAVTKVLDVAPPNAHMKILRGSGSDVFVLDLSKRQSFPLNTSYENAQISPSPDGNRLWAFEGVSQWFSSVRLSDLHPQAIYADKPVDAVFDIEQADGGRAALALHLKAGWDVTVLDAAAPDSAHTRYYPALELKELEQ